MKKLKDKNKKKIPDLDKYLIFSFVVMVGYAASEMAVSSLTGVLHDALTAAIFGAFGGEVFLCAMLKRFKMRKEEER